MIMVKKYISLIKSEDALFQPYAYVLFPIFSVIIVLATMLITFLTIYGVKKYAEYSSIIIGINVATIILAILIMIPVIKVLNTMRKEIKA